MFDRAYRRSSRTSIISRDEDDVGMGFGNTGGNGSYTRLRHQFHVDTSLPVGIFQVENQLCQIFDRIDVMMWWRRNQAYTRCRVTYFSNPLIHFMARKLPALSRFSPLCHLDLDFVSLSEIV